MSRGFVDYIRRFGDKSFDEFKFREADMLVLTQLSYTKLNGIVSDNFTETMSMKDAVGAYISQEHHKMKQNVLDFLEAIVQSRRFGDAKMCCAWYGNKRYGEPLQFAAVTIKPFDGLNIITYRGTDGTAHGWKEDFLFSCRDQTLAQKSALIYLESASEKLDGSIMVSGHSKGGNLAAYAAIFAKSFIQDRIIRVYCNDGPGFNEIQNVFSTEGYMNIKNKIVCIMPQQSIVGQIMQCFPSINNYIIHSNNSGVMQHDMFSWEISENGALNWHRPQCIDSLFKNLMILLNKKIFSTSLKERERIAALIWDNIGSDSEDKINEYYSSFKEE